MIGPERLTAWQVANRPAEKVYRIATANWTPSSSPVWDQLRRASLSVSLNLVEGYAWGPGRRWIYHLKVANGSALETVFAIRFIRNIGTLPTAKADELLSLACLSKRLVWRLLQQAAREQDE
ncbi:MAG TPA: four helix bundle protein [Gemmatimonadales bacterium]|nr:four helix bundle protein [Gemmatimonadales bacterium]